MRSKYTDEQKRKVLIEGLDKEQSKLSQARYIAYELEDLESFRIINDILNQRIDYDVANRLNRSQYAKAVKVREKIANIIKNGAKFITLTFDNETLNSTTYQTRRRYVARYLKDKCKTYVANVDYGKENGREHYHAVVDNSFIISKNWQYGYEDAEIIGHNKKYKRKDEESNLKAVSKYITKLTHHALKNKGKTPRLIYSRNTD